MNRFRCWSRRNIDVGLIYVFALSSIAVYGVILGGWASNNKYGFFGALRSSAQMIAYELPLGLGLLGVILATGSLRLDRIIETQASTGFWFALSQPLGFLVFLVASFAEAGRLPFDLPECEQELVGGYHTEYSGMKLLMFLIAEFLHMITAAFLISILFLGGWHLWGLTGGPADPITWPLAILRVAVLVVKVIGCVVVLHAGSLVVAAIPVRPADDAGLEGHVAAGHREPVERRGPVGTASDGLLRKCRTPGSVNGW